MADCVVVNTLIVAVCDVAHSIAIHVLTKFELHCTKGNYSA